MSAAEQAVWSHVWDLRFSLPVKAVWRLFVDPAEARAWLLPFEQAEGDIREATVEGQPPVRMSVLDVDRQRRLRIAMSGGNLPGRLEITADFEATAQGAAVRYLHEGFGPSDRWEIYCGSHVRGWSEAIWDLEVYVRTGVVSPRHVDDRRASIAAWPVERKWGVELAEVFGGGFADQAGLASGDILIKLDRMGVYTIADIWAFTRARAAGEDVEAQFIRDGAVRRGRGQLSRFEDFGE